MLPPRRKRRHRSSKLCPHAIQSLTDLDSRATVVSIDGISAFDLISRATMLDGLSNVRGGEAVALRAPVLFRAIAIALDG